MARYEVFSLGRSNVSGRRGGTSDDLYAARDDDSRPKYYNLVMFPYPSGDLHIGHWYNYTGADIYGRFMRMRGYNVSAANRLRRLRSARRERRHQEQHPAAQLDAGQHRPDARRRCGRWARAGTGRARSSPACPTTTSWTQWLFLQFYKHGLAYRTKAPANWCPTLQHDAGQRAGRQRRVRALRHARSSGARSTSGCCASPNTPTNCCATTAWTGPRRRG